MRKILLGMVMSLALWSCGGEQVTMIYSVAELAQAAAESNGNIKMKAGIYQIKDYLTPEVIESTQPADSIGRKAMLLFSGSDNRFDLRGVTIEIDTELLGKFGASINEIQITGANNLIEGLTITDIGNYPPTGKGARSFVITGDNNKVDGVTLNMSGSSPFGYGDLLGKGGGSIARLQKHSGLLVEGLNDTIVNCNIYSKSFGHLFFVQGGRNVYFENCYAEAVVRSTDEMLAETSGAAFDLDFQSVYKNQKGDKSIVAGYAKSLSECGFRNYGSGGPAKNKTGAITIINCRAKNTRIGFALTYMGEEMIVEGCEAQGCEVGYALAGVTVKGSRGDAENGPLLYIGQSDQPCDVELELMPATSDYTIHCLAAIVGNDHKINLSRYNGKSRDKDLPILIGTSRPAANNGYSPMGSAPAVNIELTNNTGMPVILSPTATSCIVVSDGVVINGGHSNTIKNSKL